MTSPPPTGAGRAGLAWLVSAYVNRRPGWTTDGAAAVELLEVEPLDDRGRLLDVVARAGDALVHVPVGLRASGDDGHVLGGADDPVLGVHDTGTGIAVAFDAVRDAQTACELLRVVAGTDVDPARVRLARVDTSSTTLVLDDRFDLTVFDRVLDGPRPGVELLEALDRVGFNHLAPPVALWRRTGRDLGMVQEHVVGASSGWALARTSVRDLFASGVPPEDSGGDFAAEATRLGAVAARMHLALDACFGRRAAVVGDVVEAVEQTVAAAAPDLLDRPGVVELVAGLRHDATPCPAIRVHGDFHLGRVGRAEQGWIVTDFGAGEQPVGLPQRTRPDDLAVDVGTDPVWRSPAADVADMLWSFWWVAYVAAQQRDPAGRERERLAGLVSAWEQRNRRAFLVGYLAVAGVGELLPDGRDRLTQLDSLFELERAALRRARLAPGAR